MNKKHLYEAPETELILVKFEGNFCASPAENSSFEEKAYMQDRSTETNWW